MRTAGPNHQALVLVCFTILIAAACAGSGSRSVSSHLGDHTDGRRSPRQHDDDARRSTHRR